MRQWTRRVLGALLLLGGAGLAAMTEQGLLDHRHASDRHGGQIIDVGATGDTQVGHGYLVRVAGPVKVVEAPYDPEFGQRAQVPVLIRHVEMFQWREVRVAGDIHYELDWVDRPVDSSRFAHPAGHANPERFLVQGKQFDAGQVRLGGYSLSPVLLHALPGSDALTPDMKSLPSNLAASFSLYDRYLTTSAKPEQPRLGDLRVSWETVPPQQVTVFAQVDGDQLVPAASAADGKGYDVQVGDRALVDVVPDVPESPSFVWPRRIAALLLGVLGALLLLPERPRTHHDVLLAVGASTLLVGALACVMWLGTDMTAGAEWFGVALVGLGLAVWRIRATAE
ncbi:MAG TPA: TMEM43 family protein [Dyella sp.]|uniref:TMEM43 family protein n=1 Tax=Dyella sp. TaxID=1869338 RepID=UPI002D79F9D5|nr:TMEM43 family protein [Dyella sp.]HET6555525.1 TMEM43 family protein [Dyella sp.]